MSESTLDDSLIRSVTARVLLGELDPPGQSPYSGISEDFLSNHAHPELAREAARQSIVLFKNDNRTLPLDKMKLKKVAVIGPMAYACHLGNYSGSPWFRISPLQGIRNVFGVTAPATYEKVGSAFVQLGEGPQGIPWPQWFDKPQQGWCSEGGECLENNGHGSWESYEKVYSTGATEIEARIASDSDDGHIEVHLDSLDGPLVATIPVPNTGGMQKWIDARAPFERVEGEHEMYLRFVTESKATISLEWFRLSPKGPVPDGSSGPTEVTYALGCSVDAAEDGRHLRRL